MQKTTAIVILSVSLFLTHASSQSFGMRFGCQDFYIPTSFQTSFSFGPCSISYGASAKNTCTQAPLDYISEFSKITGEKSYQLGCNNSEFTASSMGERIRHSVSMGKASYKRTSVTTDTDDSFYFAGGKSTADTNKEILKSAEAHAFYKNRDKQQQSALASAIEEGCEDIKDPVYAMMCSFKERAGDNYSDRDKYFKEIDKETERKGLLYDMAAMPEFAMPLPSEEVSEVLPQEMRKEYQSIAQASMSSSSLLSATLLKLANHKKEMYDIVNENVANSGTSTFDKRNKKNIDERVDYSMSNLGRR